MSLYQSFMLNPSSSMSLLIHLGHVPVPVVHVESVLLDVPLDPAQLLELLHLLSRSLAPTTAPVIFLRGVVVVLFRLSLVLVISCLVVICWGIPVAVRPPVAPTRSVPTQGSTYQEPTPSS